MSSMKCPRSATKAKGQMLNDFAKRLNKLSVVAGMYDFDPDQTVSKDIATLQDWNILCQQNLREACEPSLVLSDLKAVAKGHSHPWMFWNAAMDGTKVYILAPEKDRKPEKYEKKKTTTLESDKISWEEFIKNPKCCVAMIDSTASDVANYILVPTNFTHEVYTMGTGKNGIYVGLSGFGYLEWNEEVTKKFVELVKQKPELEQHWVMIQATALQKYDPTLLRPPSETR